jgi:hypothetical protein
LQTQSWNCLGSARSSTSLIAHLGTIYNLIQAAYDHATDAYNHATDGINRANAAQRSADSAYSLANTANNNAAAANNNANNRVSWDTFNAHRHKTCWVAGGSALTAWDTYSYNGMDISHIRGTQDLSTMTTSTPN